MTSQELYEHVGQLAHDLDVKVWICANCEGGGGQAWDFDLTNLGPTIWLNQSPDEPVAYFTALHELGHHADPLAWKPLRLDREEWAWRWALEQSLIPATPEVWADILDGLRTYARDRRYKRTPNFNRLLKEAKENSHVHA